MFIVASATDQGSWLLAEAQSCCDRARERLERALADLRAISADCAWKADAVRLLLQRCEEQQQELVRALDQLSCIASGLRVG